MRLLFITITLLATMSAHASDSRFVPVCMNGDVAGKGVCPSQPKPGVKPESWSCTRDSNTSLVWSTETGKGTWNYAANNYPATANQQSRCGFSSGWRLPTRSELLTILVRENGPLAKIQTLWNKGKGGPDQAAIDARYFPDTKTDVYWTSDTLSPDPSMAWFVYFKPGFDNEGNAYADSKSEENYVRLVHDSR